MGLLRSGWTSLATSLTPLRPCSPKGALALFGPERLNSARKASVSLSPTSVVGLRLDQQLQAVADLPTPARQRDVSRYVFRSPRKS
jgi:hypothetical protein